jgi:uncharacterized protein (DUF1501 family)
VPAAGVLQIGSDSAGNALGLNPRLTGLKSIFDSGRLALIQRTGYANSSRSHFQGTDIWSTGDPASPQGTGWLGRYLDLLPSPIDPLSAWATNVQRSRFNVQRSVRRATYYVRGAVQTCACLFARGTARRTWHVARCTERCTLHAERCT